MLLTLDIKESAVDKIAYLLSHLKDDVTIVDASNADIESISKDDPDYRYIMDARKRREEGEKSHEISEVLKKFQ